MKKHNDNQVIPGIESIPLIPGRREFIKVGVTGLAGILFTFKLSSAFGMDEVGYDPKGHWWGFMVDLTKCIGCGACVRACKAENNVPDTYFRTWVERYTILDDGEVKVDSPNGALNGFTSDPPYDPGRIEKSFFVPKLCNHCVKAPCVQVCPVGATYATKDGVVLVDHSYCIGCGYCVQACPYGSRFLNPAGYADKCTLCYHRITKGMKTACVQACPVGARVCGNLKELDGPLRRLMGEQRYGVLKPDLGTQPKCYYIGLEQEVR